MLGAPSRVGEHEIAAAAVDPAHALDLGIALVIAVYAASWMKPGSP